MNSKNTQSSKQNNVGGCESGDSQQKMTPDPNKNANADALKAEGMKTGYGE